MDEKTQITLCGEGNAGDFQDFVMSHPKSLIYHTERYKTLLKHHLDCDLHYYLLKNGRSVQAVFAGMSKTGKYGSVLNSLPFFGSNGGILASSESAYQSMLSCYNKMIKDMSFATFIENPFEVVKKKPDFNLISHRICQVSNLHELDLENLGAIFTSKKRNDIRRALRHKVSVEIDFSEKAKTYLIETHSANMLAINASGKPKEYFYDLFGLFRAGADYDLYTAKKDGELVAALLLLYHKNTVEYYTPVISLDQRHLQALSLTIYEAMKINKLLGRTIWNWGGNGNSLDSVYRFKKNWGASDYPYNYFVKSNAPLPPEPDYDSILNDYRGFYLFPFEKKGPLN
jgi:hypothetical protein